MSRYDVEMSRFAGTNDRDGTCARVRGIGTCPVPSPVPFRPLSVPVEVHGSHCLLTEARGRYVVIGPARAAQTLAPARAFAHPTEGAQ